MRSVVGRNVVMRHIPVHPFVGIKQLLETDFFDYLLFNYYLIRKILEVFSKLQMQVIFDIFLRNYVYRNYTSRLRLFRPNADVSCSFTQNDLNSLRLRGNRLNIECEATFAPLCVSKHKCVE